MDNKGKNVVIIILGPPGSGKGVQGNLLSERLGLYSLETSKILEKNFNEAKEGEYLEIDGEKYYHSDAKKLWLEGKLVFPPFVFELVRKKIQELYKEGKGILFSGSPRSVYEGEKMIPLLMDLYGKENIKVVILNVSPETTIWRNSHRRICELMRHSILFTEDTKNLEICPLDGSKLVKRVGLDDVETIKVRIEEYKERTKPVIEFMENQGLDVEEVNSEATVSEVHKNILNSLGLE